MGFLSFLKKKDVPATSMPAPPSAPGTVAVSKFDDRLEPLKPLAPPQPPGAPKPLGSQSMGSSSLPPLPTIGQAPPPPPAPKPLGFPAKPADLPPIAPPKANPLPPPPMPKSMAPKPAVHSIPPPAKPAVKPLPELKERLPPISLEGSRLKDSHVPRPQAKVAMPQVTPPIHGKSLPPAKVMPPSKPVQVVPPEQNIPSDEDIRKVLADLEETPVSFSARGPEPVVTESHEAYIPIANFDEALEYIHETSTAISHVQHLNEKLGHIETQTKTTIENIGKTFEGIHTSLLALDEKLFEAK